ncbi:MAG: hypothetical protein Fur0017_17850 [Anaerolineales bacterium]
MSTLDKSNSTQAPKSSARIVLATWITVTNILALGLLVLWASFVLCSLISYPPSEKDFSYYFLTVVMYAYPFIILSLVVFTRYAYKKGWDWTAQITSIISILPVLWFLFELSKVI